MSTHRPAGPVRRFFRSLADAIRFAGPTIGMSSQTSGHDSRTSDTIDSAMLINMGRDIGRDAAGVDGNSEPERERR